MVSILLVDEDLKEGSYREMGINIGTPAALNAAFGYWFNSVGLRVSGMYIKRM